MCRIFGFRSILQSGVHRSLIDSDNAIIQQSDRHPDGWGVAYYNMGSPHLVKNENQARKCQIFEKVSGVVSSNTVVTHIRKSTVGAVGPLNTHPFQFGPWVFAHNGNVENFAERRQSLLQKIDPDLCRFILGETDSEALFYLLLTVLRRHGAFKPGSDLSDMTPVLQEYLCLFTELFGPPEKSQGEYDKNYLTFLLTDGRMMLAFNGGQPLFYSTHKSQCPDRSACGHFNPVCEKAASSNQKIHHLLISSEVIKNENIWNPLEFGHFVGVDRDFVFHQGCLSALQL
jgi:glutamine amidotransferase